MQENTNLLLEFFDKKGEELATVKNDISSIFQDIGNFVVHTSSEIGHFKSIVSPYLEYFYPMEIKSTDICFINEIVLPGNREMANTIDEVLRIMRENEELSDKVSDEVRRVLDFQGNITIILGLFEEIKTFIENNSIIAKENAADADLSEIKNKIAEYVDTLSGETARFSDELNFEHKEFNKIRNWMHRINRDYLTQIKSRFKISYNEINDELRKSSKNIERLMKHLSDIERAIINIINNLLIEDIERQNLERVIFLIDDIVKNFNDIEQGVMDKIGSEKLEDVLFFMIRDKIYSIKNSFSDFLENFDDCFDEVKQVLNDFSKLFGNLNSDGSIKRKISDLDIVYRKNSRLGKNFITQVKRIIEMKKKLYELINSLNRNKQLEEIKKDSRNSIINSNPDKLISRLKEKIEVSLSLFDNMNTKVDSSISEYHYNFLKQGEILQRIVFSVKKASMKFNESLKYNRMISREIIKKTSEITEFIERAEDRMFSLREAEAVIENLMNDIEGTIAKSGKIIDKSPDSYSDEIGALKEYFIESGTEGDYKNLMIVSFLSEFSEKQKAGVVFF